MSTTLHMLAQQKLVVDENNFFSSVVLYCHLGGESRSCGRPKMAESWFLLGQPYERQHHLEFTPKKMTSVKGSALAMTLPDVPIPGKLRISKIHKNFVYTELQGLEQSFAEVCKKLDEIAPGFKWRIHKNSHGPHSSSLLNGEKKTVDMSKVVEGIKMEFRVSGCGFRVSEPLGFTQRHSFFPSILLIYSIIF